MVHNSRKANGILQPMTSRIVTKIGDIFEVPLDNGTKKYIQYIANDRTQLNSSVIRAFKTKYALEAQPGMGEITTDVVDFYAHTVLKPGIIRKMWKKVGKSTDIGSLAILFRGTNDILDATVKVSKNWHVWEIDGPSRRVGELVGDYQKAEIGCVMPAGQIVHRMRTGEYSFVVYPRY
jgi:hypothetical protein